ncbi:hypothetical protein [Oleiagrimonas sp. C23AA]|uniref:hypothetical protein n=1 Tax=Oleiagrimonas sp. C23AA TaxID=2719047 RepID=UPI00141E2565|nr:hypothetical protein [Oleiagrimonas sp. C23AA]NII11642.1 hypothetical protein [Oleiagrimonas sp. C23AA]
MRIKTLSMALASAVGMAALSAAPAMAAGAKHDPNMANHKQLDCEMSFTLQGWSAIYKTASGKGTVKCSNGQTERVKINAKGGGLTAGTYKINDGHGQFTGVNKISDVNGSYGMADAHAGAAKSARGAVMTNGDTTLSIGGTGNGWDIGVGFGSFTIKPMDKHMAHTMQ